MVCRQVVLVCEGAACVAVLSRHPNDELNYCYYLIPCGKPGYCGDVTESDLARLHNDAITKVHSNARAALWTAAMLSVFV